MLSLSKRKKIRTSAKRLLCVILTTTMLVSMITVPASAEDMPVITPVVTEDFESYSIGNITPGNGNSWATKGAVPTMTVADDPVTGRKYTSFTNTSTSSSYIGQTFTAQTGAVFLEFDVNIPGTNGGFLFVNSGGVNSTTASASHLQFDAGKLQKRVSTVYGTYDTTHWYHYKIFYNVPKKKLNLSIVDLNTNQTAATAEENFVNTAISNISSFGFSPNKSGGTINVDNIKVTTTSVQMDSLTVDGGSLTDSFQSYWKDYTVVVSDSTKTLTFTPKADDATLVFSVDGKDVPKDGTASIDVTSGVTSCDITVRSSVYDISKTYTFAISRLGAHPDLENVESLGGDSKVSLGWTEPKDPAYVKANIYQVNADNSLKLVDTVPKGTYISTISGLVNGTTYNYVVKAVFDDNAESSGVNISESPKLFAARQMESLDRGLVAMKNDSGIYVGWRLLGTDSEETSFNLYRDGVKVNATSITNSTNYLDADGTENSTYYVRTVVNGEEQLQSESVKVWNDNHLSIPIQKPDSGVTPAGEAYSYTANEGTAADVDGDGQYEMVVTWSPSNLKDNSQIGYTGKTYIDAYKMDGTRLWRIDCGVNIRSGAHYNQFLVYDLDGDGKAEISLKTADGTVDGLGNVIGDGTKNYVSTAPKTLGCILSGPEYLTVFNGETGAAMQTIPFTPARSRSTADTTNTCTADELTEWGKTGDYYNRVDRFLGTIAYLDGEHPSLIMTRGYYGRMVLSAYDFRDGAFTKRWTFDSSDPGNESYAGMGNHQLSIADVDGDGKDEIITGAACIDDNGTGLWNSDFGHGDALHVGDLDPANLGLEEWTVQEETSAHYVANLKDAETGRVIMGQLGTGFDTGRGLSGDIDPRYPGEEMWAVDGNAQLVYSATAGVLYSAQGQLLSNNIPSASFALWWDGDLSRELLHGTWQGSASGDVTIPRVEKWDYINNKQDTIEDFGDGLACTYGTKECPVVQADILGDWREEVVLRTLDSTELRIYSTTDVTEERIYSLMQDPQYRVAVASQNVGYNQPPHPSFYLGTGMDAVAKPNIYTVGTYGETIVSTVNIEADTLNLKSKGGNNSMTGYIKLPTVYNLSAADVTGITAVINGVAIDVQTDSIFSGDEDADSVESIMFKLDRQKVINAIGSNEGDVDVEITGSLMGGKRFSGSTILHVIH
ncbi:rhamnogalacturonan lyase family protein [Anaerobium acetethylicum]|uniref:Cadherin-like beta sandwich domain-containing protein n=1 Tax=Anaerobium acetethylicum TaxID=1619234 RepID=A0A1D3TY27_9FIRM|nr:cadherin-like beta sandwich domain-containing protein [Anaerobium acetethylicum]SCP99298.1 Cadherin-like beta sandwich domain-containing protein [Anaerobium acetethylicum]